MVGATGGEMKIRLTNGQLIEIIAGFGRTVSITSAGSDQNPKIGRNRNVR